MFQARRSVQRRAKCWRKRGIGSTSSGEKVAARRIRAFARRNKQRRPRYRRSKRNNDGESMIKEHRELEDVRSDQGSPRNERKLLLSRFVRSSLITLFLRERDLAGPCFVLPVTCRAFFVTVRHLSMYNNETKDHRERCCRAKDFMGDRTIRIRCVQ